MYLPREGALCCIAVALFVSICLVTGHDEGETVDSFSHQAKDIDHIKKHLKENLGLDAEAAERYMQEMDGEVQFFLMNDLNKDSRIDGLEIYQILTHRHEHDSSQGHKIPKLDEKIIGKQIDEALHNQDHNDDGYIDYEEFLRFYRPDLHTKATGRETVH